MPCSLPNVTVATVISHLDIFPSPNTIIPRETKSNMSDLRSCNLELCSTVQWVVRRGDCHYRHVSSRPVRAPLSIAILLPTPMAVAGATPIAGCSGAPTDDISVCFTSGPLGGFKLYPSEGVSSMPTSNLLEHPSSMCLVSS